jgi:tetratricopeptide (TPR) repeat protein
MAADAAKIIEAVMKDTSLKPQQVAARLAMLGEELLAADDVDAAMKLCDRALRIDPRSARAWSGRAAALAKQKRAGEALSCVERALDIEPGYADAVIVKADVLMRLGQRTEALAAYDEALAARSEDPHLWVNRARLLDEADRTDEALAAYDRGLALVDDPAVWAKRADLLYRLGRIDEAASSREAVVRLKPDSTDDWYALGRAKQKVGRYGDARKAFEKFITLAGEKDSRLATAQKLLAELLGVPDVVKTPEPMKALSAEELGAAANSANRVPAGPDLSEVQELFAAKRTVEALRKIEALTKAFPNAISVWIMRADVLSTLGQGNAAITSIERALRLDDLDISALKVLARVASAAKDDARAIEVVEKVRKLAPTDVEVHRIAAEVYVTAMRPMEAIEAYETALRFAPEDAPMWLALGRALRTARRLTEAREAAQKAMSLPNATANVVSAARLLIDKCT